MVPRRLDDPVIAKATANSHALFQPLLSDVAACGGGLACPSRSGRSSHHPRARQLTGSLLMYGRPSFSFAAALSAAADLGGPAIVVKTTNSRAVPQPLSSDVATRGGGLIFPSRSGRSSHLPGHRQLRGGNPAFTVGRRSMWWWPDEPQRIWAVQPSLWRPPAYRQLSNVSSDFVRSGDSGSTPSRTCNDFKVPQQLWPDEDRPTSLSANLWGQADRTGQLMQPNLGSGESWRLSSSNVAASVKSLRLWRRDLAINAMLRVERLPVVLSTAHLAASFCQSIDTLQ